MKTRIAVLSVLVLEAIGAVFFQSKAPVHEQSALKGVSIQILAGGPGEQTEDKAGPRGRA